MHIYPSLRHCLHMGLGTMLHASRALLYFSVKHQLTKETNTPHYSRKYLPIQRDAKDVSSTRHDTPDRQPGQGVNHVRSPAVDDTLSEA